MRSARLPLPPTWIVGLPSVMKTTTSTLAFDASCIAASQLVDPLPEPALTTPSTNVLALVCPPADDRSYVAAFAVEVVAKLLIFSVVVVPDNWLMNAFAAAL